MNENLKRINDQHLIHELKVLVSREREVLSQLLQYLKEVEDRRLYAARGYDSLFSFMRGELGYSEAAADRRIKTMRLVKDLPEVEEKIITGSLSLTVASAAQRFIKKEEKNRREEKRAPIPKSEKLALIQSLEGCSQRECEKKLAKISPETALPGDKTRILTEEKVFISFTADQRVFKKIERLKELTSHQNPEGYYEPLFEKALDLALEKLDPEKKALKVQATRSKNIPQTPAPKSEKSRYIPQSLRRRVWIRDRGACQFINPTTGKKCESRRLLDIDHVKAYALGGEHAEDNLRLLCRTHNLFRVRKDLLPKSIGMTRNLGL